MREEPLPDTVDAALADETLGAREEQLATSLVLGLAALVLVVLVVWALGVVWPRVDARSVGGGSGTNGPSFVDIGYADRALTSSRVVDVQSTVAGFEVVGWEFGTPTNSAPDESSLSAVVRVRDCALAREMTARELEGEDSLVLVVEVWWGRARVPVDTLSVGEMVQISVCPVPSD